MKPGLQRLLSNLHQQFTLIGKVHALIHVELLAVKYYKAIDDETSAEIRYQVVIARANDRILKVSRTIADLDNAPAIQSHTFREPSTTGYSTGSWGCESRVVCDDVNRERRDVQGGANIKLLTPAMVLRVQQSAHRF